MRGMAIVFAFVVGLIPSAFAQKAEIEAANSKWIEFFNKGDFTAIASLYTDDATAFPPGFAMVKGRAAIGAMWKRMRAKPATRLAEITMSMAHSPVRATATATDLVG